MRNHHHGVPPPSGRSSHSSRLSIWARFLLCLGAGSAVGILLPHRVDASVRLLFAWDLALVLFLGAILPILRRNQPERDVLQGHGVTARVHAVVLIGVFASLAGTTLMVTGSGVLSREQKFLHALLALVAIAGSWTINNIAFGLRYAFVYYTQRKREPSSPALLEFNGACSGYWEFLYLAFTIGSSFAVSDIVPTTSTMRRLTLTHSVLSFWFNTIILAFTLNMVAGFL